MVNPLIYGLGKGTRKHFYKLFIDTSLSADFIERTGKVDQIIDNVNSYFDGSNFFEENISIIDNKVHLFF